MGLAKERVVRGVAFVIFGLFGTTAGGGVGPISTIVQVIAPTVLGNNDKNTCLLGFGVAFGQCGLVRFDNPAGGLEKFLGVHRTRNDIEHRAIRHAKISGDVPTLLLTVDNLEGSHLLIGTDEMLIHVRTNAVVG